MTTPDLSMPFHRVPGRSRPLYIPRRSRHVPAEAWRDYDRPIPAAWQGIARDNGFRIDRRVRDRLHVVLECQSCGAHTAQKVFTLRTSRPACGGCHEAQIRAEAEAAGLTFLGQCHEDRHYGWFRAPCGHVVERQFELIGRAARGETGIRCETCQAEREQAEAKARDWTRIDRDPLGNDNYRLYRHSCGHDQRIARVNMHWGQCDCSGCGETWAAKPSFIYLLDIRHGSDHVLKLGYSANPIKRHRHQLGIPKEAKVEVLRALLMATGHEAVSREQNAHAVLRRRMPEAMVPPEEYAHLLNVMSEVYRPWAQPRIEMLLDAIELDTGTASRETSAA